MATSASLLNFDTFVERRTVTIDGHEYELQRHDTLSVVDYLRWDRLRALFHGAWNALRGDPTTAPDTDVEAVLDQLVRIVLRAPDDVQARLTDTHRLAIYQAFLQPPDGPRRKQVPPKAGKATSKGTRRRTGSK